MQRFSVQEESALGALRDYCRAEVGIYMGL
jgi:hypothetical protein